MEINGRTIIQDADELAQKLANDAVIGFDLETTGLSPWQSNIATMQFYGLESNEVGVIQTPAGVVPPSIREMFVKDRLFIAHNAVSFDLLFLDQAGVDWKQSEWFDTLVGETVVIGTGRKDVSASLGATLKRRLNIEVNKDIDHTGWGRETLTEEQLLYASEDVTHLPSLMQAQRIVAEKSRQDGALAFEMKLVPAFSQMTINGLPLHPHVLDDFIEQQQEELLLHREKAVALFGDINFNSPKQIKEAAAAAGVHFDRTARDYLVDFIQSGKHGWEMAQILLDYRVPAQRIKMYGGKWRDKHVIDNKIHPRFWQCGTDTGRVSCTTPNLQQVPRDGRWLIGHEPGYKIVAVDYAQAEVRAAAYLAKDMALLEAIESDDVHTAIASQVYRTPPDSVTKTQRRDSKALTFTMLFGGGVNAFYTTSRRNGSTLSMNDAEIAFNGFLTAFPGIARQRRQVSAMARKGVVFVRLLNGLRRGLIGSQRRPQVIINTLVQGNSSIALKAGMAEADRRGLTKYLGATVHDELVATVPETEAEEYGKELAESMEIGFQQFMPVPIGTDVVIDDFWRN